jgi:phosphoglycolate phosphatase/putative hydrolase of the HAD superfamily
MTAPRAILFDLDGTLYHQLPVRTFMAAELAGAAVTSLSLPRTSAIRTLRTFRRVREEMRELGCPTVSLEALQFERTAERCKEPVARVANLVDEWMFRRPLKYLAHCRRRAVMKLIARLRQNNVPLGVLSDYPVSEKLAVLDLTGAFSVTLCTTERAINAFKPHPKGFLVACERLGLSPRQVAYVGDRTDVDARGAHAAGMDCYLVGSSMVRYSFERKAGFRGSGEIEGLRRLYRSVA